MTRRTMVATSRAISFQLIFCCTLFAAALGGCQSGGQKKTAEQAPPATTTTPAPPDQALNQPTENPNAGTTTGEPTPTIPAKTDPAPAKPKPKPKAPAPTPPAPVTRTVPSGTLLQASLHMDMQSDKAEVGSSFTMSVVEPISVNGTVVIPSGAMVVGEVVQAKASGKASGQGELRLAFKSVVDANGKTQPIAAETFYAEAESGTDKDVAVVAGGAAAGAIIGGLLGGKKGAGVGGLIGAAAGTGTVLATAGPQVKLAAGQVFEIKLIEPIEIVTG